MARRNRAAIPPTPRKSLTEWIETDDGDTDGFSLPPCSPQARLLHARIAQDPHDGPNAIREPLLPPLSLALPPLG